MSVRTPASATAHRDRAQEPSCYLDTSLLTGCQSHIKATCLFIFEVKKYTRLLPSQIMP
ncbi:hypothetical protein CY34DRAFT_800716 [Suillus luteus UH-Slu-Lm8-n1]|uniref:Uncharacterized protein n=1 Tax=Suillus luteus UH-Slu-Lm8-n1 TaxID=930992 RepID=A0A0D0BJR7_9AGAM|nr:hypothetical protein CY34DRAFT_800716 [Suillus luteus UH-Slu-Lm8-n1]